MISVAEITGTEGPTITMQEVYRFEQKGTDPQGKVLGELVPTGLRPHVMERIQRAGVDPARIAAECVEAR